MKVKGLKSLEEFRKTTEPVLKWLQENGTPHQKIIIEPDRVTLVTEEVGYSVPYESD